MQHGRKYREARSRIDREKAYSPLQAIRVLKDLPPKVRMGTNENAFVGGFRMWDEPKSAPTTPARPVVRAQ